MGLDVLTSELVNQLPQPWHLKTIGRSHISRHQKSEDCVDKPSTLQRVSKNEFPPSFWKLPEFLGVRWLVAAILPLFASDSRLMSSLVWPRLLHLFWDIQRPPRYSRWSHYLRILNVAKSLEILPYKQLARDSKALELISWRASLNLPWPLMRWQTVLGF